MVKKEFGIYVHIPFCVRKCIYCDFLSFHTDKYGSDSINKYFNALFTEIDAKKSLLQDRVVTSVFIGGGTPSIVPPSLINKLMSKLKDAFNFADNIEVTIEVNPGTVKEESFKIYSESLINRISFGLQSMDNDVLSFLKRIHTKEDFIKSLNDARNAGFININADLLMGVPNQSFNLFYSTLKEVVKYNLPHISCYSLILEKDTCLYDMIDKGIINEPDEDIDRSMYHACREFLIDNGYNHYEISNFAKGGYTCRHNLLYWNCNEYLGLGLGASSYLFDERFKNTYSFNEYLNNDYSKYESDRLSISDKMNEFMMLGFRMISGPNPSLFFNRFNSYYEFVFTDKLILLEKQGLISKKPNCFTSYYLTEKGLDLANQVFMEFV